MLFKWCINPLSCKVPEYQRTNVNHNWLLKARITDADGVIVDHTKNNIKSKHVRLQVFGLCVDMNMIIMLRSRMGIVYMTG